MKILVTGGGGYIGSFMVAALCNRGDEVYVVDNFKRGFRDAVDSRASIIEGDLLDKKFIEEKIGKLELDAVVHFAGLISVGESVEKPGLYFESNIMGALHLLEILKEKKAHFIFSSTAAVYGNPKTIPIPETHPKTPTSPYGVSKLMVEDILSWYQEIYGQTYIALRYFNASGASLSGDRGERHHPETHIIPNAIRAVLENKPFHLFGQDYKTHDGTCVRDYIHVLDLVEAHILALESLANGANKAVYNVGTGNGYSNKDVLDMVQKVSGKKLEIISDPRRPGDPDELTADPTLIKKELGFMPKYSDLQKIVETAWLWHSSHNEK